LIGFCIALVPTSNGVMTTKDARKFHTGGEVVADVW
ncbi:30S ribosomal protein S8, partial [Bacillus sp. S1-R1J2-FB]